MTTYYVETYGGDGVYAEPDLQGYPTLDDALEDVSERLSRPAVMPPDWTPDRDMSRIVPEGSVPIGAWHESEAELCGGVAVWREG